jgi:hypothetical protein
VSRRRARGKSVIAAVAIKAEPIRHFARPSLENGLIEADPGGRLVKKRVALPGRGKIESGAAEPAAARKFPATDRGRSIVIHVSPPLRRKVESMTARDYLRSQCCPYNQPIRGRNLQFYFCCNATYQGPDSNLAVPVPN